MIEYENLQRANVSFIDELESAAKRVINSGWYVLGREVEGFETDFANYVGSAHCVGVASGLDAIKLSLQAMELPTGSEVLVASNTYVATILAIIQAGLTPVLVEPDISTYNIDPERIRAAVTEKTRAICAVHLYGKPCRMELIVEFAKEFDLHVVEDCAQSHGASLGDRMTGTYGNAGCFSFYPTKNLGAFGDAGAIVSNDSELISKLRHWRNYGSKEKNINVYPGGNSRLDELQAAMLSVKLVYLDSINRHKRRLAELYFEFLPSDLILPKKEGDAFDVFHIFAVRHLERDALRVFLLERGIKTEIHYPVPPHRQQAMRGVLFGEYPIADEIHATQLSLPISFGTTEDEVMQICSVVNEFPAFSS